MTTDANGLPENEDVFPDVRWGHERGPHLNKTVQVFASSRLGSWCGRKLRPLDHRLLSRSNGRYTVAGPFGIPVLLLTTTGKKSGQRRQTPLMYQRERDRLFLIGSNFGQSMHPAWSSNLLADPNAWVTMGGKEIPVVAAQLTGSEYNRVLTKFAEYVPKMYRAYRGRTDREFRLFTLTRRPMV